MSKGIVYILTNEWFKDDCVKVGKTTGTVFERIKELSSPTGIPVPFDAYAILTSEHFDKIEQLIHDTLEPVGFRINPKREFFQITPQKALGVLIGAAKAFDDAEVFTFVDGEQNKVYPPTSTPHQQKPPFRFSMVDIAIGETITFVPTGIEVIVSSDKKITYEGREYSTSEFTRLFLPEDQQNTSGAYQGPKFFTYQGETLFERRLRYEQENTSIV